VSRGYLSVHTPATFTSWTTTLRIRCTVSCMWTLSFILAHRPVLIASTSSENAPPLLASAAPHSPPIFAHDIVHLHRIVPCIVYCHSALHDTAASIAIAHEMLLITQTRLEAQLWYSLSCSSLFASAFWSSFLLPPPSRARYMSPELRRP
jgi:hypothetical protein